MTTENKVHLVEKTWKDHGLNVTLKAAELPKSTWYYHRKEKIDYQKKYSYLKPKLDEIIDHHPDYGIPRIKTELEETYQLIVNHKVLRRLLGTWDMKLARAVRSTNQSPVREAISEATGELNRQENLNHEDIKIFDLLYTDFTELKYGDGHKKAWLIPIIGHRSKLIYGWAVGKSKDSTTALRAWGRTRDTFKRYSLSLKGSILHQDQDSVFTGNDWIDEVLIKDGVTLSYSENGAKGNTYMESFNGHFKCPNRSLFYEADNLEKLREIVDNRVKYWNQERRHTSLKNKIPIEYIEERISDEV